MDKRAGKGFQFIMKLWLYLSAISLFSWVASVILFMFGVVVFDIAKGVSTIWVAFTCCIALDPPYDPVDLDEEEENE